MVYENMRSGQNIGRIKAAPNLVNICVDEIAQEEMKGRLYHCYKKLPRSCGTTSTRKD